MTTAPKCHPNKVTTPPPLHEVLPLLDIMKLSCHKSYDLDRDLCINEAMVTFRGCEFIRRTRTNKHTQNGFKVYTLAESKSGYIANFMVLDGKEDDCRYAQDVGFAIVDSLSNAYYKQHRHLYFDKLLSFIRLLENLSAKDTYACCTIAAKRKGLPWDIKSPDELEQGESAMMQRGNMIATVWYGRDYVRLVSTNCQPTMITVQRGGGNVTYLTPITMYNSCMLSVAEGKPWLHDFVGKASNKSLSAFLWYMIGIAVNNAYILYKSSHQLLPQQQNGDQLSDVDFRLELLDQLIGGFTSVDRQPRRFI